MSFRKAFLFTFILLAVAFAAVQLSDDSSADVKGIKDIIDLKGNVTLTDDITYKDGSVIVVHKDAVIDLGEYTMDFGAESSVTVIDRASFVSSGGSMVFGEKTALVLIGAVLPVLGAELEVSFDGTVVLGGIPAIKDGSEMRFTPNGDDHNMYFGWSNYQAIFQDPYAAHLLSKQGIEYQIDFNKLTYISKSSDDEGVYFVETMHIYSDLSRHAVDMKIPLEGNPKITMDFTSVTVKEDFPRSGVEETKNFNDMGLITMEMDSDFFVEVKASAGQVTTQRTEGDKILNSAVFTDTALYMKSDLKVIWFILKQHDIKETEDVNIIKKLNITAETGEFYVSDVKEVDRYLEHLYVTIDADEEAEWFLVAGFTENNVVNTLKADEANFQSLGLTTDYKLTVDVVVPMLVYTRESGDAIVFKLDAALTHLQTENLDLAKLYSIYCVEGEITLQELLDYSGIVKGDVHYLFADYDGDGKIDLKIEDMSAVLEQDARKHNTLTVSFEFIETETEKEDEKLGHTVTDYSLQETMVYIDTVGNMDQVIKAFTEGIQFTDDTVAEIQVSNSGFDVVSTSESNRLQVTGTAMSETSPTSMTLSVLVSYSKYTDTTTVAARANSVGYKVVVDDTIQHTDPVGTTELVLTLTELRGELDLTFDEGIGYTLDIHMPWDLSVVHYDMDFRLVNDDSGISVTHGTLDIEGYDAKEQGIFAIVNALRTDDFVVDGRLLFTSSELVLSRDSVQVYNTYRDVELTIRSFDVDVERGVNIGINLVRIYLDLIKSDGTEYEKSLNKLNINLDQSGIVPGPTVMELTAKLMLILFSVASAELVVTLIVLRIKRPHLFKFNE
ncbi:MAG: hypothetical protein IKQ67_03405 [Candidatus Methanomethylophilaceae archaeon]|nr:hypothetical protein [Candidatus Methanomethylophilaceae archaeon]